MRNLPRKTRKYLNFTTGVALIVYLNIIISTLLSLYFSRRDTISLALLVGNIWLWQFVYALPIALCLVRNRRKEVAKGIIAGALIMALVNIGGCFMIVSNGSPPLIFGAIAMMVFGGFAVASQLLKD